MFLLCMAELEEAKR